jgi:hypothetical protein
LRKNNSTFDLLAQYIAGSTLINHVSATSADIVAVYQINACDLEEIKAATRFDDWSTRTIIPLSALQLEDVIMRHLTLLAVLAGSVMIPVTYAQAQGAAHETRYATSSGVNPPGARPMTSENCGTPDEPKACPPLPRHNLAYYPGDRPWKW